MSRRAWIKAALAQEAEGLSPSIVNELTLTNFGIIGNSAPGDLVAIILNRGAATLSIVGGTGVLALNGDRIEATKVPLSLGALSLTIRQTLGVLTKDQTFQMTVYAPLTGLIFDWAQLGALAFEDRFTSYPDIYDPTLNPKGQYATFYRFGADGTEPGQWASPTSRTLSYANSSANHEGQTYTDRVFSGGLCDPFSIIAGGGLKIAATPTPASLLTNYGSRPVVSGMLRTRNFAPIFGYHEVRVLGEFKPGYWPAEWMYEAVGATGAELDTQESGPIFGFTAGDRIFQNTHNSEGGAPNGNTQVTPRTDLAFRTMGVLWKADSISYYIDGVQSVAPFPRPASLNTAMNMLIDLAVGWDGTSPAGAYDPTQLPYNHYVDRQRFYSISGTALSLITATPGVVTFPLVFTASVPNGVGFLRGTAQRAFNAAGAQTLFAANVAACTDLGVLIEPAAQTLYGARDYTAAVKTATTIAFNAATHPDGTTEVSEITETAVSNVHIGRVFVTHLASTQYTASLLVKRGVGTRNFRIASSSGTELDVTFDLGAGTVGQATAGTGAIVARGSWWLVSVTYTSLASPDSNFDFYLINGTTSAGAVYLGTTSSLLVTDIKVETGAKATSWVGVGGVSRSTCSMAFKIPASGVGHLTYTFDDNSTQQVVVTPGADYFVPTNLTRAQIKQIVASA